ncbi:hypothetical protein JXM67_00040 [candidate division WOR-3 bacterium]|nr:hypothetical protein [candidate division WOR-3 bacterium]
MGNTILEVGSNARVLTHPDVHGIRVKCDSASKNLTVELFVDRINDSLKNMLLEEFDGHRIRLHHLGWRLIFEL